MIICPLGDITVLNQAPSQVSNDSVIVDGSLISTVKILAFDEKQNIRLDQNIQIWDDFNFGTPYDPTVDLSFYANNPTINVSSGTLLSSHLIFLDPIAEDGTAHRARWSGQINFDQEILGIIPISGGASSNNLIGSTNLFGLDTTIYNFRGRTLDYGLQDVATFNGNTLSFDLNAFIGMDPIRVITRGSVEPVPEPLTIMGSGLAFGLGLMFKRKSLTTEKSQKVTTTS